MADADPSLHRDQSGSSQIFGYTALALYGAFLSGVASARPIPCIREIPSGCRG